jgi:hypothetical protein
MVIVYLLLGNACSLTATLCALLGGQAWWSVAGHYALGVLVGLLLGMLAALKDDAHQPP